MKKVLNLLLTFVLSVVVIGIGFSGVKAEATTDVTITVHVHQYDGVYTNTGIGVWDGRDPGGWNDWAAVQSSVDDFGAVVVLNYTAAEINAVMDSIQFEITSEAGQGDAPAQANYLSPGDGKTFLDVTTLKSGAETALDVYYVEGGTDFVSAEEGFGLIFVVYADPTVAANPMVYDDWWIHTWNNGTLGDTPDWATDHGLDFAVDMVQNTGAYDVAMRLAVIKVDDDADQDSGFIIRNADGNKQCSSDILIDNTTVRGSGTLVYYYQAKSCDLETDGPAFLAAVNTAYEMNAGNRFLEGSIITSPTTVAVELLMPKNPAAYDVSKFVLYGTDNVIIPILSVQADTMDMVGTYVSDATCSVGQNLFVLYVSSTLDHSLLGVVGSLQGWNPGAAVLSTKDDSDGNAVFEICTSSMTGEYKVLYDPDNDGFSWDGVLDPNVTAANQSFDFGNERMAYFYIDANVPTVSADTVGTFESDFGLFFSEYGEPNGGNCKYIEIYNPTSKTVDLSNYTVAKGGNGAAIDIATTSLVLSGTLAPGEAVLVYREACLLETDQAQTLAVPPFSVEGLNAIEVPDTTSVVNWNGDDSIGLFEGTTLIDVFGVSGVDPGTFWPVGNGNLTDGSTLNSKLIRIPSVITGELDWDVAAMQWIAAADEVDVDDDARDYSTVGVHESVAPEGKMVIIHFETTEDHALLGIVGAFAKVWDIGSPYTSTKDDTSGNAVFEVPTTSDTGEFKILLDGGDAGFVWDNTIDLELTVQLAYDLTDAETVEIFISAAGDVAYIVGGTAVATPLETTNVTLTLAPENEIQFGSEFYVTYAEVAFENHVTVFVSTLLDHSLLGIVGSIQGWDPANAILSTQDSSLGYAVFEFVIQENTGEFKVLFDDDGTAGLNWGDKEVTPGDNQTFTVGGSGNLVLFIDAATEPDTVTAAEVGTFVSDFTPLEGENTLILHFDTALAGSEISAVGAFVQVWDPASLTPYISTKVDTMGYAVFEIPTTSATGEFKILHDTDGTAGFDWSDTELTVQLGYDFGDTNVLELFINAAGDMIYIVEGSFIPYPVNEVVTDMGLVGTFTQELFSEQYLDELITSEVLEFNVSNNFVPADLIEMTGTYAISPTEIALQYLNINTMLDTLELVDGDANVIAIESVGYANSQPGAFTETVTCTVDENLLVVHLYLSTTVPTELAPLGLVGSVQGWNPGAAVASTGMDANGNYMFEVCVANTETSGVFKVLQDLNENGFAWGDVEMTPGDIAFDFDGTTHVYVEEGGNAAGSALQTIMLLDANKLDVTKTYQLKFTDANGFNVFIDLDIDNEAPVGSFSYKPDTPRVIDEDETFNLMDYFNTLLFVDNRDGELEYVVVTDLDMNVYGEQTVVISATDAWDNVGTLEFTFTVNDVTNPILTGDSTQTYTVGDAAPNWASLVTTNEGTIAVNTTQVDMDTVGTFFVIYTATDDSGNSATLSVEVTIEAAEVVDEPGLSAGVIAAIVVGSVAIIGGAAFFFIKKP